MAISPKPTARSATTIASGERRRVRSGGGVVVRVDAVLSSGVAIDLLECRDGAEYDQTGKKHGLAD
jgi:hypothetical protein